MHLLALLTLALAAAPDAGAFSDSPLGQKRAGENVAALDERWIEGLADGPLLARVERRGDDLAIAFYAREKAAPDAGAPAFSEKARFPIPQSRQLDKEDVQQLGPAGEVLALYTHADDPDEEPVSLTLIAKGPKLLYQGTFLRDADDAAPRLALGGPEGFALRDDAGAPEIDIASETKRVPVVRADGGAGEVELGHREKALRWKSGKFQPAGEAYRDFLQPLKLKAPGHEKLVDGKPRTSEKLVPGAVVKAELPTGAQLRILRLVPGCLESQARAEKEPAARSLQVQLDDGPPIAVVVGKPVADARLFGAGEFTLGEGYGSSEMLFFKEPLAAKTVSVTVQGQGGCLAELAAY